MARPGWWQLRFVSISKGVSHRFPQFLSWQTIGAKAAVNLTAGAITETAAFLFFFLLLLHRHCRSVRGHFRLLLKPSVPSSFPANLVAVQPPRPDWPAELAASQWSRLAVSRAARFRWARSSRRRGVGCRRAPEAARGARRGERRRPGPEAQVGRGRTPPVTEEERSRSRWWRQRAGEGTQQGVGRAGAVPSFSPHLRAEPVGKWLGGRWEAVLPLPCLRESGSDACDLPECWGHSGQEEWTSLSPHNRGATPECEPSGAGREPGCLWFPGLASRPPSEQTCLEGVLRLGRSLPLPLVLSGWHTFSALGKPIIQLFTYCLMVVLALICLREKGATSPLRESEFPYLGCS